jgi:hypothetical protein
MKRSLIAAAFVTAFASTAFAQETANGSGNYVIVEEGETPPAGYAPLVPSYKWEDGRFVRDGEVYQSLHSDD